MSQGKQGAQPEGRRFELECRRTDAGEHVRVVGEMDLAVIGHVDLEMRRAEATDADTIVLDLDELEFLDAAGVRLLLQLNSRSRSNGARLRIRPARSPQVQRVIELTGVQDKLPFMD